MKPGKRYDEFYRDLQHPIDILKRQLRQQVIGRSVWSFTGLTIELKFDKVDLDPLLQQIGIGTK